MVPLLGMEDLALEVLQAIEAWIGRGGQAAHAGNHGVRGVMVALGVMQVPEALPLVPGQFADLGVQQGLFLQAVFFPALLQIGADFRLAGEHPRPLRVRFEGEGIDVGLHVAGAARVVVDSPGAADAGVLFEDQEVVLAFLAETDRHPQPGETGADDGDLAVPGGGRGGLGTHGQAPVMIVCWRIHSSTCECRHLYTSGSSQP